jgi:hypothetical protein
MLSLPFVILLEQYGADEAHDRGHVGKDADDVGFVHEGRQLWQAGA